MPQESIVDASRPSAGRIYDYLLGGHHNFEVDRQAAERIKEMLPFMPKAVRLSRWCLQDLAVELAERRGYDVIIDYASGLPTNDHIHHVVPEGTTVIYSDYDPVVVEYAHEILAGVPNVYFFEANAGRPEELLERREVQEILGGRRKVALVYWAVGMFLTDEDLSHAAQYLYEWAAPGSCWAFNAQAAVPGTHDPAMLRAAKMYEQMGSPVQYRSLETYRQNIRPWLPDENGFVSFLEWHGVDLSIFSPSDLRVLGRTGGGYGAYLVR